MQSRNDQKKVSSTNIGDLISLPFDIKKSCTSQDPLYPITNLKERNNFNNGWVSQKFCTYPQKMIIKFEKYVNIKQINIIVNENKIPEIIQFINCIKVSESSINKNEYKYQNIGYIKLSDNADTNYQSRESRKVLLNINNTNRIKLLIHENYQNPFNTQNQVGIVSLEFIGNYVNEDKFNNNPNDYLYFYRNKISEKNDESNDGEEENDKEDKEKEKIDENSEEVKEEKKNNIEIDINKINNENNKNNENAIKKKKSILKNGRNQLKQASTLTNITINENIKNNDENKKKSENNLYYNSSKYIQNKINSNININLYDNESNKKDKKDNKMNLSNKRIENMIIEKLRILNESNEKASKNQENHNEFIKLQNEINNLKKMLNKIFNIKTLKESKKNNELTPQKKYYLKLKSINGGKVMTKIQSQQNIMTPLIKNKTFKNLERNQLRNAPIKLTKNLKIIQNHKEKAILKDLSTDNLVLLTIKNKSLPKDNYVFSNNEDSFNISNDEDMGNESLEELSPEVRKDNEFLINTLGEEIIQKIFSKNLKYKEEGFNSLNIRVNDIISFSPENTNETNDYIISLFKIFFLFIDDKHPSIVMKCLELFVNIIKSIKEKSCLNKIEYEFKLTKSVIKKIIEKFNHNSKRVREKVYDLYCYMLDSNLCEYNSLIIELIEKEVNEYFYKLNTINNNNFTPRVNSSMEIIGLSHQIDKYKITNKNSTIMKMNIFLKIFSDQEKLKKQINRRKFPENIVGDYLIMNLNNPKEEEVRQITKDVLVKYINIFGNQIFFKLKMIIGSKELLKKIQDNDELKLELKQYEEERNKRDKNIKNMLKNLKLNKLQPLSPLRNGAKNFNKKNTINFEQIKMNGSKQQLMRVSSLPKLENLKKVKLKPFVKASCYLNDSSNSIVNNTQNKGLLYLKKKIYSPIISYS